LHEATATLKWALRSEQAPRIEAALKLARSEPGIPILPEDLDRDLWLLNCPNGTLDLRTGTLHEHQRADYITKLCPTPYVPGAACPMWLAFLDTIFAGNHELIRYVQRLLGYCLTGDVSEQSCRSFGEPGPTARQRCSTPSWK
jgi:putative DNA primase/helicase